MREILFRGKCIDTGEWVYGYYVRTIEENADHSLFEKDWIYDYEGWCRYEVIPETVGQYTGLDDKNGVKIFEGDVHKYGGRHFPVKFGYYIDDDTHVEMYGWYLDSNSLEEQGSLGVDSEKYVNIIGNLHDNQELMGETK